MTRLVYFLTSVSLISCASCCTSSLSVATPSHQQPSDTVCDKEDPDADPHMVLTTPIIPHHADNENPNRFTMPMKMRWLPNGGD